MTLRPTAPLIRLIAGLLLLAVAGLLIVDRPEPGLAGLLAASVFASAIPIGAVFLLLVMALTGGRWQRELAGVTEGLSRLAPIFVVFLPLLLFSPTLYGWHGMERDTTFRALFLNEWSYALVTIGLLLALLIAPWCATRSRAAAAIALILFVLLQGLAVSLWLMPLAPGYFSSGFALYVLSLQVNIALCLLVLSAPATRTPLSGTLLLLAVLFWLYFAYIQYFVSWNVNSAAGLEWFAPRSAGPWRYVEYLLAASGVVPAALLLFPPVRQARRWVVALAAIILGGKAVECLWLALPGRGGLAVALVSGAGLMLAASASLRPPREVRP
ncbi:hypothetical protein K7H91_02365 [Martelella mediterranea]|uniref:hypothetical protein n=1 Tax=Martelella mediterranea TaxID=293089 RepID=UPI001E386D2A|nr:hypothetical protein [Martelella mediterranea]MCD1632596.1 hypothetical protein [Martelella mediterranea]